MSKTDFLVPAKTQNDFESGLDEVFQSLQLAAPGPADPPHLEDLLHSTKVVRGKRIRNSVNDVFIDLPSGKLLHNYGKIHHFQWENPLFLWPFSIAILT